MRNYFKPGNLTALRELALRRTAQRVDEQMVDYMRAHAISGPWAAGERVLVGVNEDPGCLALVRYTRRLADRLRAPWSAVHIETSKVQRLDDAARDRIADALRLAERLGGEAVTIPGTAVAEELIAYARANNCTHIVITSSRRSRLAELLQGSTTHQIIRQAGEISVHVIAGQAVARSEAGGPATRTGRSRPAAEAPRRRRGFDLKAYAGTLAMVAVALGVGLVLQRYLGISMIALVFLTAVLASAITYGLWPALVASLVSTLAYNFFFLPPLYTFTIADPENVVALFFFAIVALIASNLTSRVRSQALAARQRAKTDGGSLSLQPQARRRGDPGRSALGHRLSDRPHAEGDGGDPAAGGRHGRRAQRLSAGGHASTRPIWRRPNGAGRTIEKRGAAPTPCRAPSACSCPSAPAAAPSAWWAWRASGKAPCSRPISAACSMRSAIRRRSPSSARPWPMISTVPGCWPRPTGCARPC